MTFSYTVKTALRALRTNKSRSFLTILGIVIGITAIILISSLGQGAQNLILDQVQGLGSRTIAVRPGKQPRGPSDAAQFFSESLKARDVEAIKKKANVPTVSQVIPLVIGAANAVSGNKTYSLTLYGVSEGIQDIFTTMKVGDGTFWTADDVRAKASVVVLGPTAKQELFGDDEAVGKKIRIKNQTLRVVGILATNSQATLLNFDKVALIPYTTAQEYILGIKHFNEIIVEADTNEHVGVTVRDIKSTIRELHNITDEKEDDFYVETQEQIANSLGTITSVLTAFLASVAGISLFVAGIGIMNIMLVSVTERTREIGLRKALGATEGDILKQFLFESITLTATGGVIGIILGTGLSFIVSVILSTSLHLSWTFTFPIGATILGISISALVGLVFGLYPARQASRKSPIEALRYE